MNKLTSIVLVTILFAGCGGGGSAGEASGDNPSSSSGHGLISDTSQKYRHGYALLDYLSPKESRSIFAYQYQNGHLVKSETLKYEIQGDRALVRLASDVEIEGKVDYRLGLEGDRPVIEVSLDKGDTQKGFELNAYVDINETVSFQKGECRVTKHLDTLKREDHHYSDLLEITCPESVGYYAKDQGLVVEDIKGDIESNDLEYLPDFKGRKIAPVDRGTLFHVENLQSAREAKVDKLWGAPYYLNGEGMRIGLVDGGRVLDTHIELAGKIHNLSNAPLNKHATHTAGTLVSSGIRVKESHGFAVDAQLYTLDYHKLYFADALKELLKYDVLISNHSYGFEGSEGIGEYDRDSEACDKLIFQNPYIIAVIAAGNDGRRYRHDRSFTRWGLIKGGANAKNVITVAAVDDNTHTVADFSSRGPIKGGRLKPDIALDGYNVLSTIVNPDAVDNDSYGRLYGTSMAAPAVTGTLTLLSQRYKEINGANPRVDTLKAIIFNTARDIENPGPDFKSGFGELDALKAVKVIDSMEQGSDLVKLEEIRQNEHITYDLVPSSDDRDLRVTVAWVDSVYDSDALVYDIDSYVEDLDSGKHIYPYTLNEFFPDRNAKQTKPNHLDPQEQIAFQINPDHRYRLHILGTKIPDRLNFTLVSNMPLGEGVSNMKAVPLHLQVHDIYESIKEQK